MRLELRKLNHLPKSSRETNCYEVQLYIDGKRIAFCTNTGTGGATRIQPYFKDTDEAHKKWAVLRDAEAYCNGQPPHDFGMGKPVKMTLELWVDLEVERLLIEKYEIKDRRRLERTLQREIVFVDVGDGSKLKHFPGRQWDPALKDEFARHYPEGFIVLNELPLDEAMRYYMA